jgi:hypothetical protein
VQRQLRHAPDLSAVVDAPCIFAPRAFLCIAEKVRADMVMMAKLCTADAAEIALLVRYC